MRHILIPALSLIVTATAMAQTTAPTTGPAREAQIKKLMAAGEKDRAAIIAAIKKEVAELPTAKDPIRKAHLERQQGRLQALDGMKGRYMPMMPYPTAVGIMGTLPGDFTVVSVVGDDEMIVRQVQRGEALFWLKGKKTEGLVDGNRFLDDRNFEVTGTRQYNTARGARTVFELSPVTE